MYLYYVYMVSAIAAPGKNQRGSTVTSLCGAWVGKLKVLEPKAHTIQTTLVALVPFK